MSGTARSATDQERLGLQPPDRGSIELGTVGWGDGGDRFAEEREGEPTLVKVTLRRGFRGAMGDLDTRTKQDDRAQGSQILCRVAQPLNYIPPENAEVFVALPAGYSETPGAGAIFAVIGPSAGSQFKPDQAMMDFGPDCNLFIKARSVTISDYENRFSTVGPDYGIKWGDAQGNGGYCKAGKWYFYVTVGEDARTILELADGSIRGLTKKPPTSGNEVCGFTAQASGDFTVLGKRFCSLTDGGMLGKTSTPATKVAYLPGPSASPAWSISPI